MPGRKNKVTARRTPGKAAQTKQQAPGATRHPFGIPLDTSPMEARRANALPNDPDLWQYEPKWDGFRCLVYRNHDDIDLMAKSGKTLARFFPEVIAALKRLPQSRFVLDGELVIPQGRAYSFDALQARLHPSETRIRKLSGETPARLVVFDMLVSPEGESLLETPLNSRREALEAFMAAAGRTAVLKLSPCSCNHGVAARWLRSSGRGTTDGVVAKLRADTYHPGERAMVKVKKIRTADCVVGGFRYESDSKQVGSLLLGLYNADGELDHVGFTSGIKDEDRATLTEQLEALRQPPGFTGKAPGGPSRWATTRSAEWVPLRPSLVVEVAFDQVTTRRFRHGTKLVRWRPDKAPKQCQFDQIL